MLTWLKSLTDDNKVKVLIVILGAAPAAAGYFGQRWFESPSITSQIPSTQRDTNTQNVSGSIANLHTGTSGSI